MKPTTRILIALCLMAAAHLPAQSVPEYINYQGLLKAADGSPLATANYTIEFNIYDQANGGSKVWGPFLFDGNAGNGHGMLVPVVNGGFNVILGPKDTSGASITNAFAGPNRFIEIKVNGGAPILPRQQFLSTAYALQSQKAQLADVASTLVKDLYDALCPPGSIMAFAGPTNRIPDGWLLCDGRILASTNYPRLFAAIRQAWGNGSWNHSNRSSENPDLPWTDFNLPDLRGVFLRAANGGQPDPYWRDQETANRTTWNGSITEDGVGTYQADGIGNHIHPYWDNRPEGNGDPATQWWDNFETGSNDGAYRADQSRETSANTGYVTETRPKNACVNYIIKY